MLVTAIEGIVENGKIRLQEDVSLPESAKVLVILTENVASAGQEVLRIGSPRLVNPEDAKRLRKQVLEIPKDAKI